MKSEKLSVKKQIKRRVELSKQTKMGIRDKLRASAIPPRPIPVDLVSRSEIRRGIIKNFDGYPIKDYGEYLKPENVDYDVLIYISSYNRYKMVSGLLTQLFTQETKYKFKIILMNDGSKNKSYNKLPITFPEIIYLKNPINYGRNGYWKTINKIFNELKNFDSYAVIQIDDDFVLCKAFIDKLMDKFFELKMENNSYMGIRYHIGSFNANETTNNDYFDNNKRFQTFDGGSLFDTQFLKLIDYKIKEEIPDVTYNYNQSHVWGNLNNYVKKLGVLIYTLRESLALHNDGGTSKMHPEYGISRIIYSKNFIDDKENSSQ